MPKRQPLPSQSARFHEMTRKPARGPPPTSSAHQSDYTPQHANDDIPSRGPSSSHTPSGHRQPSSQEQGSSDANSSAQASASSARARTRFGAPPLIMSEMVQADIAKREALARKDEPARSRMEVDQPSRGSVPRDDDAPYRQSGAVRNDRVERVAEPSMGAVPTGPRAMARNASNSTQAPPPASSSQGYTSRGPPPPPLSPVAGTAPPVERSGRERLEPSSQSAPHGPRSFENGRAPAGNDAAPSRRMYADSRPPVCLLHYFIPFITHAVWQVDSISVPGQRTSGANAFPIARKRGMEDSLTRQPEPTRQLERADWREPAPHLGNPNNSQVLYETERRVCFVVLCPPATLLSPPLATSVALVPLKCLVQSLSPSRQTWQRTAVAGP